MVHRRSNLKTRKKKLQKGSGFKSWLKSRPKGDIYSGKRNKFLKTFTTRDRRVNFNLTTASGLKSKLKFKGNDKLKFTKINPLTGKKQALKFKVDGKLKKELSGKTPAERQKYLQTMGNNIASGKHKDYGLTKTAQIDYGKKKVGSSLGLRGRKHATKTTFKTNKDGEEIINKVVSKKDGMKVIAQHKRDADGNLKIVKTYKDKTKMGRTFGRGSKTLTEKRDKDGVLLGTERSRWFRNQKTEIKYKRGADGKILTDGNKNPIINSVTRKKGKFITGETTIRQETINGHNKMLKSVGAEGKLVNGKFSDADRDKFTKALTSEGLDKKAIEKRIKELEKQQHKINKYSNPLTSEHNKIIKKVSKGNAKKMENFKHVNKVSKTKMKNMQKYKEKREKLLEKANKGDANAKTQLEQLDADAAQKGTTSMTAHKVPDGKPREQNVAVPKSNSDFQTQLQNKKKGLKKTETKVSDSVVDEQIVPGTKPSPPPEAPPIPEGGIPVTKKPNVTLDGTTSSLVEI